MSVELIDKFSEVAKAVKRWIVSALKKTSAQIHKDSVESIERKSGSSHPGSPPHTHTSVDRGLRGSVAEDIDEDNESALIGPRRSKIGRIGEINELGGEYHGAIYPPRPFMGPALERNLDFFASSFSGEGSIGE